MWPRTAQGVPPHTARRVCLGFAIRKHPIKTFVLIKINKRGPHPGMSCLSCVPPTGWGGATPLEGAAQQRPLLQGLLRDLVEVLGGLPRGEDLRRAPRESSMASGAPPRV